MNWSIIIDIDHEKLLPNKWVYQINLLKLIYALYGYTRLFYTKQNLSICQIAVMVIEQSSIRGLTALIVNRNFFLFNLTTLNYFWQTVILSMFWRSQKINVLSKYFDQPYNPFLLIDFLGIKSRADWGGEGLWRRTPSLRGSTPSPPKGSPLVLLYDIHFWSGHCTVGASLFTNPKILLSAFLQGANWKTWWWNCSYPHTLPLIETL